MSQEIATSISWAMARSRGAGTGLAAGGAMGLVNAPEGPPAVGEFSSRWKTSVRATAAITATTAPPASIKRLVRRLRGAWAGVSLRPAASAWAASRAWRSSS